MANKDHLDILKKGVDEWNRWRAAHKDTWPDLSGATLSGADLSGADLRYATLDRANLSGADLRYADLSGANLSGTYLSGTYLGGADLSGADLSGANFRTTNFQGVDLTWEEVAGLEIAVGLAYRTRFIRTQLVDEQGVGPSIVDASWTGTILSVIDWSEMTQLGDEKKAHKRVNKDGSKKEPEVRLEEYKDAVRAANQFALVLQNQGISYASDLFYKSKHLGRRVLWYRMRNIRWHNPNSLYRHKTLQSVRKGFLEFIWLLPSWLFSWFLFIIAGYGYRLRFCLFWYFLFIFGFALAYLFLEPHYFTWWTALGESVNIFHGRGASPNIPNLTYPARFAILTVLEAWSGLVIEVIFVATLLQRFFGK